MAKTRAQPFGNFDTSGALAGIRATVEGAQFEAALKQRSWENLLGTVERTVTGVANRKLAREEMANREEEWRARLAQDESQFTRSLEEQRSERAQSQSWREKLFEYGKFKDVQGERQKAIDRILDMKETRRLESRADTLRSMDVLREARDRAQTLMMNIMGMVNTGALDQDSARAMLTNISKEDEARNAALRSQEQAAGIPPEVLAGLAPGALTAMSELLTASIRDRAKKEEQAGVPGAGKSREEQIADLTGEIEAYEKTPASGRNHFATERYKRNVTMLSQLKFEMSREAAIAVREQGIQALATRAGMVIEDPALRNRFMQRLQQVAQLPAEQAPAVFDEMEKELNAYEEQRKGAEAAAVREQRGERLDKRDLHKRVQSVVDDVFENMPGAPEEKIEEEILKRMSPEEQKAFRELYGSRRAGQEPTD